MKKLFRTLLCGAVLTLSLSVSAFAAESDLLISPAPSFLPEQPENCSMLVNGEPAVFTDAVPKLQDGRPSVPYIALLQNLGFAAEDMTWDSATETVTATKGDTTVSLTIGKNQITLTKGGETTVVETDVTPYVDTSVYRTYVSPDFAAEVLGCRVGWDAYQNTVIIDDVDAILAANDETYTLMDKYLAYSKRFMDQNQKVTGGYAFDLNMNAADEGSTMDMGFTVDGDYSMVTSGATAFLFDTDMTMDMSVLMDGQDLTAAMAGQEGMPQFPLSIDFEMRGDMTDGIFYFQSTALAQLMEQPDMANAWFKLDMGAMFDQMSDVLGMDYASLIQLSTNSLNASFEETLAAMLKVMPLTSADLTTSDYLAQLNALLGDSAFRKSGSSYVSTLEQDGVVMTFVLYTSGSQINGYAVTMAALDPDAAMEMNVTMKDKTLEMDLSMEMVMGDMFSLNMYMNMDGTYQSTKLKPVTAPPTGAVVVDLTQMLAGLE